MSETSRKKAVTGHFMAHWGVPSEIHVQEKSRIDLAVVEFAPKGGRATYRFATNGMSAIVQPSRGGRYRTELYASSRSAAPWIVRFLAVLAVYPIEEETSLGEMQTVPLAGPIVQGDSIYSAILIAPPGPEDPETLGAILGVTTEAILVHRVVPISELERDFAAERGSEELWQQLLGLGRPLLLDEPRPDAVRDHA
jgi:hypothetical protein